MRFLQSFWYAGVEDASPSTGSPPPIYVCATVNLAGNSQQQFSPGTSLSPFTTLAEISARLLKERMQLT